MKKIILSTLLFLLFILGLQAKEDSQKLNELIYKSLENKVITLIKSDQILNKESVIKILGRPDHRKESKFSYIRDQYKYAIHITFKDNHLIRLDYKITKNTEYNLKNFAPFIDKEGIKEFPKNDPHNKGKYLTYSFNKFLIFFKNNSSKSLTRIVYEK